jgi:nucleoside-diphosphate-sugar epimerase
MNTNSTMTSSFLSSRSLLLTGATGFVGKATLELLLRDHHPHIDYIFLLMRASKKKSIEERYVEILSNKIFSTLQDSMGFEDYWKLVRSKVIPISGDVLEPRLGISDSDFELLKQNANYVIHCAATVDFNAALQTSFNLNVAGTQKVMELCDELNDCLGFEYVSTAYTNSNLPGGEVLERVYPMNIEDPKTLIDLIPNLNESEEQILTQKILGEYPNLYTFVKALSEHNALDFVEIMKNREIEKGKRAWPVCIVRPTIVTNTAYFPLPGWSDGLNGHNGIILYSGLGIFDTMAGKSDICMDLVPVDFLVQIMIRSLEELSPPGVEFELPYFSDENSCKNANVYPKIYHAGSSNINPITLEQVDTYMHRGIDRFPPMKRQILSHSHKKYKNDFINALAFSLRTEIRFLALFAQVLLTDRLKFAKMRLLKSKLHYLCDCFRYFWNNGWIFRQDNVKSLKFKVSGDTVSNEFTINRLRGLSWEPYLYNTVYGVYYYVLKESASLRVLYDIPGWECVLGKSNRLVYQCPSNKPVDEKSEPIPNVETEFQILTASSTEVISRLNNPKSETLLADSFSSILVNKAKIAKLGFLFQQDSHASVIYISKDYSTFDPIILSYIAKLYNLPVPGLIVGNNLEILDYSLINDSLAKLGMMKKPNSLGDKNNPSVENDLIKALASGDSIYLNSNSETSQNVISSIVTKIRQLNKLNPVYIVSIGITYEHIPSRNLSDLMNSNQVIFPEFEHKRKGVCYFNSNDPILVASNQSEIKLNTENSIVDQLQAISNSAKVVTPIQLLSTILHKHLKSSPKQNTFKFSQIRSQMRELRLKLKELGQVVDVDDFEDMNSVLNYSIEFLGTDYLKVCQTDNGDQLLEIDNDVKFEKMLVWYSKSVIEILN